MYFNPFILFSTPSGIQPKFSRLSVYKDSTSRGTVKVLYSYPTYPLLSIAFTPCSIGSRKTLLLISTTVVCFMNMTIIILIHKHNNKNTTFVGIIKRYFLTFSLLKIQYSPFKMNHIILIRGCSICKQPSSAVYLTV